MKLNYICIALCLLISQPSTKASLSIGVSAIGAIGAVLYAGFDKMKCSLYECCSPNSIWVRPNMSAVYYSLEEKLHGQHLVRDVVVRALKAHLYNSDPPKAMVMSFHGWTGSGKNHVARIISEGVFKLGLKSQYVHLFVSTINFPHEKNVDIYKLQIQDWIRGNVSSCERSLFIFDEIDKMSLGMIDSIKPFIDYHENIFGIDFRKSIFIFLSNTGSHAITKKMLEMWKEGKRRQDITLGDMEDLIQKGAFNEVGGLHNSELIQHSLVDYYVPFLPLERHHIELCARDELVKRGHSPSSEIIRKVTKEMKYFPPDNPLYSTTGCKRVAQKVGYLIAEASYDELFSTNL